MSVYRWFSPTFVVLVLLVVFICSIELLQTRAAPEDAYVLRIYNRLKEGKQVSTDEYHQLRVGLRGVTGRDTFEYKHSLKKGESTQLLQAKCLIQLASPWPTLVAEAHLPTTTVESP